jgi:hypothetical protein
MHLRSSRHTPAAFAMAAVAAGISVSVLPATASLSSSAPTATGSTVTVVSSADSYVDAASPGVNYGTATVVKVGPRTSRRAYLRFVVPAYPQAIRGATLRLNALGNGSGVTVSSTAGAWSETGITYRNAPAFGTAVGHVGGYSTGWISLPVSSLITGPGTYTLVLTSSDRTVTEAFSSREAGSATAPQLLITVGPAPTPSPTGTPVPTGTPTPSPTPGGRNPLTWPFASTSIWNMPIGSGAVYVPAQLARATVRTLITDQNIVIMDPTAPLTPIESNSAGWSGADRCPGGSTLATAPIPPGFLVPSAKHNYAYAVVQPDGHTVSQGQPFTRCVAGGPATAGHTSPTVDLYTDGTLGAHGGSGLSSLGGTIRMGELVPGGSIPHALEINVDGAADLWPNGWSWPAIKEDSYGPSRYGGKVPQLKMGGLLAIPASVNLDSLGLQTAPGRMLAQTFQNYGAYVVDDSARSVNSICTELGPNGDVTAEFQQAWGFSFVTSGASGTDPWSQDINTIYSRLAVVSNNGPNSIGGGGTPLQPLAPPLTPGM